jgi:hypothetical protein
MVRISLTECCVKSEYLLPTYKSLLNPPPRLTTSHVQSKKPTRLTLSVLIFDKVLRDCKPDVMEQPIVGYHKDDEAHWVAELACGHNQHVRNNPPMVSRPWVETASGRDSMLGFKLNCKKCDIGAPVDNQ